jgi:outer membrane protein assembly factor BamB
MQRFPRLDRRSFTVGVSTAALLAAMPAGAFPQQPEIQSAPANQWPFFRGNPHSTGQSASELPAAPEVLWKFEVKGGAFASTAAIDEGVVYIGDRDGEVFALDLKTGEQKWKVETETGFVAPLGVRGDKVYAGDYDGMFHCYSKKDGKELWTYDAKAEINSSPNFYKDLVLFGSQTGVLYALDAEKGTFVWQYEIQDQIQCSPTIVENRCFLAGCDQIFHVLDLDKKGEKVGGIKIGAPSGNTPAVKGDFVYFGTMAGVVYCVDWRKVEVKWTFADPENSEGYFGSPAIGKYVFITGKHKILSAIDLVTGKEKWQFAGKSKSECSPVIVGDRVFAPFFDGRIYAVDVESGKAKWEYEMGARVTSSPAVADGKLVIATEGGTIYCFGKKS